MEDIRGEVMSQPPFWALFRLDVGGPQPSIGPTANDGRHATCLVAMTTCFGKGMVIVGGGGEGGRHTRSAQAVRLGWLTA